MNRARRFLVALILVMAAIGTNGQSRTSEGVSAILRGDYQQAAAILQPIAADPRLRDPAAAFFMATLYDSGRGVPLDPMRACALYQQAFFDFKSVYAPTAQALQRRLWMARGNDWFQECQLVANIGINHHFQPETFTLGAGHTVEWTLAAATVTYQGRTNRTLSTRDHDRAARCSCRSSTRSCGPRARRPRCTSSRCSGGSRWEGKWTLSSRLFEVYRDEVVPAESPGDTHDRHSAGAAGAHGHPTSTHSSASA